MTNEDRILVADYMGWTFRLTECHRERHDGFAPYYLIAFDLNDASLCAQEMQKRGEWWNFLKYANTASAIGGMFPEQFIALLFNADNFFKAFVEWRKGNDLS